MDNELRQLEQQKARDPNSVSDYTLGVARQRAGLCPRCGAVLTTSASACSRSPGCWDTNMGWSDPQDPQPNSAGTLFVGSDRYGITCVRRVNKRTVVFVTGTSIVADNESYNDLVAGGKKLHEATLRKDGTWKERRGSVSKSDSPIKWGFRDTYTDPSF